jgi:hypothetical protein
LIHAPLESSIFHSGLTTGGLFDFFWELGGMVFDIEPMIFPPGNVGGEFV